MDFKLFVGVDLSDYDDISEEMFDSDSNIDIFINDGDDYMLAGKMLFDENDIKNEPYESINLKIISDVKRNIKSRFKEVENDDIKIFVIYG